MSTPMFIERPTVGSGTSAVTGQSLSAFSGSTPMADLTAVVDEPTLIEAIVWSAQKFSTQLGMLILAVSDGINRRLVGAYALDAGTASLFANGTIVINFVVAPGYKLVAAHNAQDITSAYTTVDAVPFGGIIRAPGVLYGAALPAPDIFYRGKIFTVFGATGVTDALYVCVRLGDGTYGWFPIGVEGTPGGGALTQTGYSAIASATVGNGGDYLDVAFPIAFTAATGPTAFFVDIDTYVTGGGPPPGWSIVNRTVNGMRIQFSAAFDGEVRWRAYS